MPQVLLGRQDAPCAGARICPLPGHPCLDSVTDADVLDAVAALVTAEGGPAAIRR